MDHAFKQRRRLGVTRRMSLRISELKALSATVLRVSVHSRCVRVKKLNKIYCSKHAGPEC